jgi:predicted nucleic acid-binding protein
MARAVLTDTSFWFALFDRRDEHHEYAQLLADDLRDCAMVIPWPCLYETLNTRFAKRRNWVHSFERMLRHPLTIRIEDSSYRNRALLSFFECNRRPLSLVDIVIREILAERSVRIDAVVTFNTEDFRDICDRVGIELLGDYSKRMREKRRK